MYNISRVTTGLERFVKERPLWAKGKRLGLLCHQASVDTRFVHAKELINEAFPGALKCLFSPQHGLYAEKQDNMIESADGWEPSLGIPIYSLYGEVRQPRPQQLSEIDVFIIDLQDVGCRVYTYIWTMLLSMRACAKAGVEVCILDRPNPIGGVKTEGNLLDSAYFSFVGMASIPMRHGMTMGELALMFKKVEGLDLDLHIVKMDGWHRSMSFPDTGLPWVWPSPNMPTFDTAMVYPGQVVLETTNLSEGRGTTRPFEVFGAPFLEHGIINKHLEKYRLRGFVLRPQNFEPTFHKWQGKVCRGLQIHVTDRGLYQPYLTTLSILSVICKEFPDQFKWTSPPYEYEFEKLPADLVIGNPRIRKAVEAGIPPFDLERLWKEGLRSFEESRRDFLLY